MDREQLEKRKAVAALGIIFSLLLALGFYFVYEEADKMLTLDEQRLDEPLSE